ncbi:MAG: hypothetical protein EXS49_00350 [Candidatus Pacebacteria bacterium]|nr:hypothetical protein [Candidatus Paceibacterota bacterium]
MEPQKKSGGLWIILAVIVLGGLVYMFIGSSKNQTATDDSQNKVSNTASAENDLKALDTSSLENELGNIEKELK